MKSKHSDLIKHIHNQIEMLEQELIERDKLINYYEHVISRFRNGLKDFKEEEKLRQDLNGEKVKRITRHDPKLDALLGKKVKIEFFDNIVKEGILNFQDEFSVDNPVKPYSYYLKFENGDCLNFRKSHIKKIYFNGLAISDLANSEFRKEDKTVKINRRDPTIDKKLGKHVKIEFKDGDIEEGILLWSSKVDLDKRLSRANSYYLRLENGSNMYFRKAHVRKIQ